MDAFANAPTLQYKLNGCDGSERFEIGECSSVFSCNLEDVPMQSGGKIIEFSICLKNVCPGRRTALAIELYELDEEGNEYARGLRTCTLPAHQEPGGRDILIENIRFVLPEYEDIQGGSRRFLVRKTSHYADMNHACPVKCREE